MSLFKWVGTLKCDIFRTLRGTMIFLYRPWISPWIKSISDELDIIIHVIASQLSGFSDVINNRLWHHQQNVNPASEAWDRCVKIVVLSSLSRLCRVRNKIMYVLSRRTVSALTRVLFWCLFPSLLRNSGNKHQHNPFVSAETVRHSSTYNILHIRKRCRFGSTHGHMRLMIMTISQGIWQYHRIISMA